MERSTYERKKERGGSVGRVYGTEREERLKTGSVLSTRTFSSIID